MREIKWMKVSDGYVAQLQYGKVTILPRYDLTQYLVRIENVAGKVVASGEFDLDGCKAWATVNLPLMDEVAGEFGGCGNVQETLTRCQRLLFSELDAVYWLRLEFIKVWMAARAGQTYTMRGIPRPKYSSDRLNWVEQDGAFVADTTYGQAVIRELQQSGVVGGGSRFEARLVHRSEATLASGTWLDFVDAEQAIRKNLDMIGQPTIDNAHIDIIRLTLDICQRILPTDADPIHFARLTMLETHLLSALS